MVSARITAARAITHEAILLYWDIGRGIEEKQKRYAWGESAIDQISIDLLNAFPGSTGYSPRNLRSARQLYLAYSDPTIWLQPVAKLTAGSAIEFMRQVVSEIPWGQNLLILNKITDPARWGQSSRIHMAGVDGWAYFSGNRISASSRLFNDNSLSVRAVESRRLAEPGTPSMQLK